MIIPIVAIVCAVGIPLMIPIVAIMTGHQRKMAELMRGGQNSHTDQVVGQLAAEVHSLRQTVAQMQDQMNQLAISVDGPARRSQHNTVVPEIPTGDVTQRA
ncbi:MAG: hypothetical protein ABUL72_06320 [Armatimonadota bacterium]